MQTPSFVLAQRAAARDASHRFVQSLELLSHGDATQRLAGIYGLDGLSRENSDEGEQLRGSITEVLSAFVRREANWETESALQKRTSMEVQAALTALSRTPRDLADLDRPLDLNGISLRGAYLPFCHFERAFLYNCDFEGALLVGAHLQGTWLAHSNFTRANLDGADLRGADLTGTHGLIREHLSGILWDKTTRWP